MPLEIKDNKDVKVVSFIDISALDGTTIKEPADEIDMLIQGQAELNLVINFANINFVSSAGLGRLVKMYKLSKKSKGKIKLCNIKPNILQVLKVTKLDKIFEIHNDEDKAVKSFKKSSFKLFGR